MKWMLVFTLWRLLYISSICFAAPQDVQPADNTENIIEQSLHTLENSGAEPPTKTARNLLVKDSTESHTTENEPRYFEMSDEISSEVEFARRDGPGATIEVQSSTQTPAQQSETNTPITITITRPTKKPNKKPKPVRATTTTVATTLKPVTQEAPVTASVAGAPPSSSSSPTRRYPCRCGGGLCSCCTGIILENFNVPIRSRACANVTYEPDDFAFNFKLLYNDRLLYNNRMSAKNPPPACITINRFFGIKMCAKMTNVFLSGRNVHACLEMEGFWDDEPAFNYPFNCFRFGSEGVAFVRPEDGGGLPPPPDEEEQIDEDYDDNARGWTGDVLVVPN